MADHCKPINHSFWKIMPGTEPPFREENFHRTRAVNDTHRHSFARLGHHKNHKAAILLFAFSRANETRGPDMGSPHWNSKDIMAGYLITADDLIQWDLSLIVHIYILLAALSIFCPPQKYETIAP
jgi:hypothetical protein